MTIREKAMWCRFDGMTWPCVNEAVSELDWRLRYLPHEQLTRNDIIAAASIISAYIALVGKTQTKRNYICSRIQKELDE